MIHKATETHVVVEHDGQIISSKARPMVNGAPIPFFQKFKAKLAHDIEVSMCQGEYPQGTVTRAGKRVLLKDSVITCELTPSMDLWVGFHPKQGHSLALTDIVL